MRWTSTEYFLLSQLEPSQNKRPVVRALADVLLQVRATECVQLSKARRVHRPQEDRGGRTSVAIAPWGTSTWGAYLCHLPAPAPFQMRDLFARTVAHNPIPHWAMSAGVVVGGLFLTYDTGRFLTGRTAGVVQAAQGRGVRGCMPLAEGFFFVLYL